MQHSYRFVPLLSVVLACASASADHIDPAAQQASQDRKLAIAGAALDNGPPWFGARVQSELTERTPLQAWTFELPAAAFVTFATQGTSTGPDLDTVLYLYRFGARGWGAYVTRNDDHAGGVFSSISRALQAGRYRVVVKGRTPAFGPFALSAACSGEACPPPEQPSDCIFGRQLHDAAGLLRISTVITYTAAEQLPDRQARERLVASAAQLTGAPVATPEQLFARADAGLVRWLRIWDDAGAREFGAYEYLLRGRSYGAVHAAPGGEVVARVSEGTLVDCRVPAQRCALGESFQELLRDRGFALRSSATLDESAAEALPGLEQEQLLQAVRVAYPDAEDIGAAFASVDANQVRHIALDEIATDRHLSVYEYGAGDNSFGAVFNDTDSEPVARIEDGAFAACSLRR